MVDMETPLVSEDIPLVRPSNYYTITSDKKLKGSGLRRGDYVLVTNLKVVPIKKDDPYLQRVYAVVLKVEPDGTHLVPGDLNDYSIYLVDPRNLAGVHLDLVNKFRLALASAYA